MVKIKIEKTRGYPAIRKPLGDLSKSLLVLNKDGKHKTGNKKGLVRIEVNDIAVVCLSYNGKQFYNIYKILEIDPVNSYMYVDKICYDETLPEYLIAAVEEAKRKIGNKGD